MHVLGVNGDSENFFCVALVKFCGPLATAQMISDSLVVRGGIAKLAFNILKAQLKPCISQHSCVTICVCTVCKGFFGFWQTAALSAFKRPIQGLTLVATKIG